MPNTTNVSRADGAAHILQKYYTARNVNATAASRNPAGFNLRVGDIVVMDPFADARGDGYATGQVVAIPTANFLYLPTYVVTAVHPDVNLGIDPTLPVSTTNTGNIRAGGWIDVASMGVVSAWCANGTNVGTLLEATPGSVTNNLADRAAFTALSVGTTALTDASADTVAELGLLLARVKATALVSAALGAAGNAKVHLNIFGAAL